MKVNKALGKLRSTESEFVARNRIRDVLTKLDGIDIRSINTLMGAGANTAVLQFKYNGTEYEYRSTKQANVRLNLIAIKQLIESKVRFHVMGLEDFGVANLGYLRLGGPGVVQETSTFNDKLSAEECALFEVEPYASNEQVRKQYLTKCKFYHPDRFQDQPDMLQKAQDKTAELNRCYSEIMKRRGA